MIITYDRTAGMICGGGVCVPVGEDGEPLMQWCRQALVEGYELRGRTLEMWDLGASFGNGRLARTEPMLCLTALDAYAFLCPPPKPKKGKKKP